MKALLSCLLLLGCARDVEICDSAALAARTQQAVAACHEKGLAWVDCPDRPRILKELREDLERCSP